MKTIDRGYIGPTEHRSNGWTEKGYHAKVVVTLGVDFGSVVVEILGKMAFKDQWPIDHHFERAKALTRARWMARVYDVLRDAYPHTKALQKMKELTT